MNSFNPYFTGSNSGRAHAESAKDDLPFVSILILLEVILEDDLKFDLTAIELEFQSLFYWK